MIQRCGWVSDDELYQAYHDNEWGIPVYDDARLFEKLILEGFQAGLSWITILRKRENFRRAFDGFDAEKIARYDATKLDSLMQDAGIVRNRLKIESAVKNAQAYLDIREKDGSFSDFVWQFVDGQPIINRWPSLAHVPAETAESRAMSKALKARGFKFVGSTICYAFMQSMGLVCDHEVTCYLHPDNIGD